MAWSVYTYGSGRLFATDGRQVRTWLPETGGWHLVEGLDPFEIEFPKPGDDDPAQPVGDLPAAMAACPATSAAGLAMYTDRPETLEIR